MDTSTLNLVINALVYAFCLIYTIKKAHKRFSATSFIIGWYLFSAISSVLFYTHPITEFTTYYNPIIWKGLFYFTGLTLCLIFPIYMFEKKKHELESAIDEKVLLTIIKCLLVLQILVLCFYMSDFFRLLNSDFGEIRDSATQGETSTLTKKNPIIAWLLTFNLALRNIITIIAFYTKIKLKKNKKLVSFFFMLSLVMPFFLSVLFVMRSFMVFQILLVTFLFIFFHKYFSYKSKKIFYFLSAVFLIVIISFMINVSENRFGDMVTWYYYKYAGETFVNFSGQMWPDFRDCTSETIYFQWIGKLLGSDFEKISLSDKWQYLNSVTGIDTHIFYGFIGGLVIEFHFLPTVIIIGLLVFLFNKYINSGTLRLSNLLLIGELANVLFTGSFLFAFQGLWGNFEIIFVIFFYIFIRNKEKKTSYHENLIL